MEATGLFQLHEEHKQWLNNLTFYREELEIMLDKLAEIAKKNSSMEIQKGVEHFQSQFFIQKEQMDILIHHVKLHEEFLEKASKKIDAAVNHKTYAHMNEEEEIDSFEKIFNTLRSEFYVFNNMCVHSI